MSHQRNKRTFSTPQATHSMLVGSDLYLNGHFPAAKDVFPSMLAAQRSEPHRVLSLPKKGRTPASSGQSLTLCGSLTGAIGTLLQRNTRWGAQGFKGMAFDGGQSFLESHSRSEKPRLATTSRPQYGANRLRG